VKLNHFWLIPEKQPFWLFFITTFLSLFYCAYFFKVSAKLRLLFETAKENGGENGRMTRIARFNT
jgi:hypothetical protein